MELKKNNLMNVLFNLGLFSNILPYYGDMEDWKKLYYLVSKKTKALFIENIAIFRRIDHCIFFSPFLETGSVLKISMEGKVANQKQTNDAIMNSRFKRVHKLYMFFGCGIGIEDSLRVNEFYRGGLPHTVPEVYIKGAGNYPKIDKIREGLAYLLPKVTVRLTIVNFTLEQEDVKTIFEQAHD